jgi:transposase
MNATTIGLDLAKSVFQVHGADADGAIVVRKKLRRAEVLRFFEGLAPCLVGMEACASAHHWAREIAKLGHEVRLMPPAYVKAYVRRQKNDAADAAAICEAVTRPSMRFVAVKSVERQGVLTLHRARELLIRQRTMLINAVRGYCAEFGIVTAQGAGRVPALLEQAHEADASTLPEEARFVLRLLGEQLDALGARIHALDRRLLTWYRQDAASQRLATIPGVGLITATALSASVADPTAFRTGREFAAFLGLVPRQNSSGGKERLGRITKMGDGYLRKLLVVGATAVVRRARTSTFAAAAWLRALLERKPARVASVAMANKTARIAWAVLARGEVYRPA